MIQGNLVLKSKSKRRARDHGEENKASAAEGRTSAWQDEEDGRSSGGESDGGGKKKEKEQIVIPLMAGWQGGGEAEDSTSGSTKKHVPMLIKNRPPGLEDIKNEKDRFRQDMNLRPDLDSQQYNKMRIEDFGAGLLRGMGWKDEGKTKAGGKDGKGKKVPIAIVNEPRPALLGLGAMPKPEWAGGGDPKKHNQTGQNGRKNGSTSQWLWNSAVVQVVSGRYEGEVAVVKLADGVPGLNNIEVYLDPGADSDQLQALPVVMIKRDQVKPLG